MWQAVNPATGETVETYEETSADEALDIVEDAHGAYAGWRELSVDARAEPLRRAAGILRDRADDYAELMAEEMGKPLRQGVSEAEKCAWLCDYYADHGAEFLAPEVAETDATKSYVAFLPTGVVLGIMPWNFPFWQVLRYAAPALLAGNATVLKHAPNVPGCALAIEELFAEAGFPEDLFRALLLDVQHVGKLIEHPLVTGVTLTGSVRAGKAVAGQAGAALKKTVMELGGSDPYVVLEDADLERTVETCATSRLINSGQSCIAAKRFLVVDRIREEFEDRFVERMSEVTMGDPMEEGTEVGPQARHDLRDALHEQVRRTLDKGARLLLGGTVPDHPGAFYPPTVLTDVRSGTPAWDEELFGPVAAIIPVADEEEAVEVANETSYGLGAAVFTADPERGERIARDGLEAGCCFVNDFVRSDPRLPFGGIKQSGYGRELSHFGIREFVNVKTVWVK